MLDSAVVTLDRPRIRRIEVDDQAWGRTFVLTWMSSAALVTAIRLLHSAELRYDLSVQVQAAQNLLRGRGLATFGATSANLADQLTLVPLTYFPCGYSFAAAALLLLGGTPAVAMKILGAAATMLGWWGWARLALAHVDERVRSAFLWRLVAYAIGALMPLLYTLPWGATDIFLWACVPWILLWIVRSAEAQNNLRLDLAAGALTGFALLMRYASAFLAVYALALIACQSRARVGPLARRSMAYLIGLAPALALQGWINTGAVAEPLAVGGIKSAAVAIQPLNMATANSALFFWAPRSLLEFATETRVAQLLGVIVLFALPILVAALHARSREANRSLAVAAAALLPAIPVFLWLCELLGARAYSTVPRYYAPAIPAAVLIAGFFATTGAFNGRPLGRFCRMTGRCYIVAFVAVTAVRAGLLFSPDDRGANQRARALGAHALRSWPSSGSVYEMSAARRYVTGLMQAQTDAVLLTNVAHWFYADGTVDLSRVRRIEFCNRTLAREVRGPARLLILASDRGGPPDELLAYSERRQRRAGCFESLAPFTVIRFFPDEQLKLLERRVPLGTRLVLNDAGPE